MNEIMEKDIRTVCFTGHREIPTEAVAPLADMLADAVSALCERGATVFRAGGAVGFDTLAALTVLDMKARYPAIRLELILPCRNQAERWDEDSMRMYQYILERADSHHFLMERYTEGCMQARDRLLVEGSDVCVAYCARSQGGTAYTAGLALRGGLEFINLFDRLSN